MRREEAVVVPGMWAGMAITEAGGVSGWHHHGDCETGAYVVAGEFKVEFGPSGSEEVVAGPGDFVHIPAHAIHRESNPTSAPSQVVVMRAGRGPVVVNVAGPAPPD
jgi:uncharacterized RmlC-like cupin family protein